MRKFILMFCLIVFFSFDSKADLPPGGGGNIDECEEDTCDDPTSTPLDDHVLWLIGASATFGTVILRGRTQKI